jgi:glutaconate CoA-transferase subunit A
MDSPAPYVSLDELVAHIPDGCLLAVPKPDGGAAMAATRALIRRGAKNLYLYCLPAGGFQADLLVGAGCVATIECSGVTLGEAAGAGPRFRAAVESGAIRIKDATCQALYTAIQAAEKGMPFAPIRGLIGSDVLKYRDDWKTIQNPYAAEPDPIVVLPAVRPDLALFHARLGDKHGNVWVGNARECVQLAHAARTTLVTVEAVLDGNLMAEERYLAGTIPPLYLGAVALAPRGAWPLGLPGYYGVDTEHLQAYAAAARTERGFADYLARHVLDARLPT